MRRARPSPLPWWLEAIALLVGDEAFEAVRSRVTSSAAPAMHNASDVVRLERVTGTFHERAVQRWVLPYHRLVEVLDIYYGTVHFVGPPLVLAWLWWRHPDRYARWRNTLIVATVASLAVFALYPLAPPRLLPPSFGFVDTARTIGGMGPLDAGNFKDTNPFAAMPSLHLAWSTWCACAVASATRHRWLRLAVFGYPLATLFVVVATANHYFLDAVGGWALLALGWLCAFSWERHRSRRTPAVPPPEACVTMAS